MKKDKPKKGRPAKYEEKTIIAASFKDLMKAAVKNATAKSAKKKG